MTVKDNNDNEASEGNQCDNNSYADALLDDDVRVMQIVVNSSDDYKNLSNVFFTNYLEKHELNWILMEYISCD